MTALIARSRGRRGNGGFTLIELLVVIVILGILAGVVVFSVSGVNDKGESAASEVDERTIRTAQEAFFAQNGSYAASTEELAAAGFLAAPSTMHHIAPTPDGSGFAIADGQPVPDAEQVLTVGFKADPWSSAMSKLRFSRFALDAGTCETITKVRNDYSWLPGWPRAGRSSAPGTTRHTRPGASTTRHGGSSCAPASRSTTARRSPPRT